MKKLLRSLLILPLVLLLPSCDEELGLLVSNEQTMGTVAPDCFITDQGLKYNIFSKECEGDLFELKRAFIVCDVLRKGKEPASYDIVLKRFTEVGLPEYEIRKMLPEKTVETDPVQIYSMWTSGRYLNFQLAYPAPKGSDVEHVISFITYTEMEDGFYVINLIHNAGGEVNGEWDPEAKIETRTVLVSLPLSSFYTEGTFEDISVPYEVRYTWYTAENGSITTKTVPTFLRGTFKAY